MQLCIFPYHFTANFCDCISDGVTEMIVAQTMILNDEYWNTGNKYD